MLSFDHPQSGAGQQQPGAEPASATTEAKPFPFDIMQNTNQVGNNGGMFDLQGMNLGGSNGMSEFAAMLQQNSQGFTLEDLMGNANAQPAAQSNQPQQNTDAQQASTQNVSAPPDKTGGGSSETDQILAQLGAFTAQENQQAPAPDTSMLGVDQASGGMGDDDINALLASLGDTDGQDFTNFDFSSDLDMTNLGEMAGLFNTSTTADEDLKTGVPPEPQVATAGEEPKTVQSSEGQQQAPIDLTAADPAPPPPAPPAATQEPKKEEQPSQPLDGNGNNDFTAIDMDDFNFGDGDEAQEGMGMSGDEFDRLLAGAFND